MRMRGLLSRKQVEDIHCAALRVLEEVGVQVEHPVLRDKLASIGAQVDKAADRVRFPRTILEDLIQNAPRHISENPFPTISMGCNIYQCQFLDPDTNKLKPFDEDLLARYYALARSLPGIKRMGLLGLPFVPDGISPRAIPLAEKLYAWKHGVGVHGSVCLTELCEPLLEVFQIHASATGKSLKDVFRAGGYLISPLKLARSECEQVIFFAERGLKMWIGHLPSQGGTAPVTLMGTVTLILAEQLFMFALDHALWGDVDFHVGGVVSTIDMRNGTSLYGRPERQRVNLAFADIAEFYGCSGGGHTGCTDAHTPSFEAGVQKSVGALFTALATGSARIEAGLLGVDEICSPVQMILDHDMGQGLGAMLAQPAEEEMERVYEEIAAAGPGGNHLGTDYTVERFKESLFEPFTWSRQLTPAWLASGAVTDVDKARDIVADFDREFAPQSFVSEEEERELRAVIRRVA